MVRAEARRAPPSGIAAVMSYARGRPGLIPLWVGRRRPADARFHLRAATVKALRDGETFYTWQGGIPELRDALARYHARHFGRAFRATNFSSSARACRRSSWRCRQPPAPATR